jgi:hypothetical protein
MAEVDVKQSVTPVHVVSRSSMALPAHGPSVADRSSDPENAPNTPAGETSSDANGMSSAAFFVVAAFQHHGEVQELNRSR